MSRSGSSRRAAVLSGAMVTIFGLVLSLVPAAEATATQTPTVVSYADIPLQETGRIDHVLDGDTVRFVEDGASDWIKVRLLGVNTPEVTGFNNIHFETNMCGGQEALHLLESILPVGTRVQLRSYSKESSNRGRILRYMFAYNQGTGEYDIDVQSIIARSGLAMWFTLDEEAALSYPYRVMIDRAQRDGLGIWNPGLCGAVEQPAADISVTVSWDAPGSDQSNLNGEFVVLRNIGSGSVDLSGWLLRDSSLTSWFTIPPGTVLSPGDYRVAHVGSGTAGAPDVHDLYIGSTTPLFPNTTDGQNLGDGAYLLDRSTAVRFYFEYPCISDCADPLQGNVKIVKVNAKSRSRSASTRANEEYVVIKNVGSTTALLDGYYLRRKISTYPFATDTRLAPGQSLMIRVGKGSPTATTQYWGQASTLLNDRRDRVELLSGRDVILSVVHW